MKTRITSNGPPNLNMPRCDGDQARARQPDTDNGWQGNTRTTRRRRGVLCLTVLTGLTLTAEAHAVGETTRISVNAAGKSNGDSTFTTLSADGHVFAFHSNATNLVPDDTNGQSDVFVYDGRTHQTTRVNVDSSGEQAVGNTSNQINLSADGRYVAFTSEAGNLVPGDTNGVPDVFVHDRDTHETTRVSVASDGTQGNKHSSIGSWNQALSANGRFVAFVSSADNLVPGDTKGRGGIFVHDRKLHQTTLVSEGGSPSISADGRYVAFVSSATDLVPHDRACLSDPCVNVFVHDRLAHKTSRITDYKTPIDIYSSPKNPSISADGRLVAFESPYSFVPDDRNKVTDIYVHDRLTQQTSRVSVASNGDEANSHAEWPSLSADGRFVTFSSFANTLVAGDINARPDVFVHDRLNHRTTLISVDSAGNQGDGYLWASTISADGRFVAFSSSAKNLVPGDTNWARDAFLRDRLLDRSLRADLAVSQTVQPDPAVPPNPLRPLVYTVTAVNNGPDAAGEVTLYDRPPGNGTLLSVVPSQGECSGGAPFICRLGALEPGASSTVTVTVKPKTPTSPHLRNTAHINAAPFDPQPRNNKLGIRFDLAP